MADRYELRLPALEVRQSPGRTLYTFAVDGKQLPLFAAVSRVRRGDHAAIEGYQRPEVVSHITSIRHYLESASPLLPNAIVVAFDERISFEPAAVDSSTGYSRHGTLVVPVDESLDDADRPGWIVDGQQRTAAIREANVAEFPICVTAFIADNDSDQRAQFILVNSTKPLPKGLIYELLPTTDAKLPPALARRRLPSRLLERLNYDEDSPLHLLVNTPTNPMSNNDKGEFLGIIKDNSMLRMIENSISDGALYRYRDPETGEGDVEAMLGLLKAYWSAVRATFPKDWGLPPRKSRLMHGVGIVSMGYLMDTIAERQKRSTLASRELFERELSRLADTCHWTSGEWEFGAGVTRAWNALQNTKKDTQDLTNYLAFEYRKRQHRR